MTTKTDTRITTELEPFGFPASDMVRLAEGAAGPRDKTRPVLNAVHLNKRGWLESADGFKLFTLEPIEGRRRPPPRLIGTLFDVTDPSFMAWLKAQKDAIVIPDKNRKGEVILRCPETRQTIIAPLIDYQGTFPDTETLWKNNAGDAPAASAAFTHEQILPFLRATKGMQEGAVPFVLFHLRGSSNGKLSHVAAEAAVGRFHGLIMPFAGPETTYGWEPVIPKRGSRNGRQK